MAAPTYTTYHVAGRSPAPRHFGRHLALVAVVAIALAIVAFFLAPTGHANLGNLVQVNGAVRSVTAGASAMELAGPSAVIARAGSSFDLCGDLLELGKGSPAEREMDGQPLDERGVLQDGASLIVRNGGPVFEKITKTTEQVPFETRVAGEGKIVSLAQTGALGKRDVYSGASSGRQAAMVVTVAPKHTIYQLDKTPQPDQKLAALTFDDGPGTHTLKALAALASRHVFATFFVQGAIAAAYPDVIAQMKEAGHEVENHTWNHPWLDKLSAEEIRRQISRTNSAIGGSEFLRPPYGAWNATVKSVASSMGLRLAFWTVDTRDWERQEVEAIMSHVKAETKPGAIILMHDGGKNRLQTVAAIPVIIDWLFAQGYSLTTVDQIL